MQSGTRTPATGVKAKIFDLMNKSPLHQTIFEGNDVYRHVDLCKKAGRQVTKPWLQ